MKKVPFCSSRLQPEKALSRLSYLLSIGVRGNVKNKLEEMVVGVIRNTENWIKGKC